MRLAICPTTLTSWCTEPPIGPCGMTTRHRRAMSRTTRIRWLLGCPGWLFVQQIGGGKVPSQFVSPVQFIGAYPQAERGIDGHNVHSRFHRPTTLYRICPTRGRTADLQDTSSHIDLSQSSGFIATASEAILNRHQDTDNNAHIFRTVLYTPTERSDIKGSLAAISTNLHRRRFRRWIYCSG